MESLTRSVYECTLAVEAHMICDLLASAGISARVDGEFLSGVAGELPLGNLVRVRVAPTRATEAREVIDEWEALQPPDGEATPPRRIRFATPLLLLLGAIAGGGLVALAINLPRTREGVDYDGDGRNDITFHYAGPRPTLTEFDRNFDGRTDARWVFGLDGLETRYQADDDFDGRFEWQAQIEDGTIVRSVLDADGDGRPEQVWHFAHGVPARVDYHFASGGRVVKRAYFRSGLLESAEFDDDGDGVFERRVKYDRHGDPQL